MRETPANASAHMLLVDEENVNSAFSLSTEDSEFEADGGFHEDDKVDAWRPQLLDKSCGFRRSRVIRKVSLLVLLTVGCVLAGAFAFESKARVSQMQNDASVKETTGLFSLSWLFGAPFSGAPVQEEVSGQCSLQDLHYLEGLRRHPQALFVNMSDCAIHHAVSWRISWLSDAFIGCMEGRTGGALSRKCLGCYNANAEYSFLNCKMACLCSWCSSTCLKCTKKNHDLPACVGKPIAELPTPATC